MRLSPVVDAPKMRAVSVVRPMIRPNPTIVGHVGSGVPTCEVCYDHFTVDEWARKFCVWRSRWPWSPKRRWVHHPADCLTRMEGPPRPGIRTVDLLE